MALSVLACAVAFQRRLTGLGWVGRRLLKPKDVGAKHRTTFDAAESAPGSGGTRKTEASFGS